MNKKSSSFIDAVADAPWFAPLPEMPCNRDRMPCSYVEKIRTARSKAKAQRWFTATCAMSNWLSHEVQGHDYIEKQHSDDRWNDFVIPINERVNPLVAERFAAADESDERLMFGVQKCVTLCALQYSFYDKSIMPWLVWLGDIMIEGYLPCGWEDAVGGHPLDKGMPIFYGAPER